MAQLSASDAAAAVGCAAPDAYGYDVVREFCADAELIRRLRITPEELKALSESSLLGSICSRQDVLFMLRIIRSCMAPPPGGDNTAAIASEMAHEMSRGASAGLHHSTPSAGVGSGRR